MKRLFFSLTSLLWALSLTIVVAGAPEPVQITLSSDRSGADISPDFLGLSYEISTLSPEAGKYYFDRSDQALVNTFKTLGIKSLRVGANAVDDPRKPIPQEKDIDSFFGFARAAGVKVIYSFRLKNGNPSESARLARYISDHDADALDCFSIGNEPGYYTPYDVYFAKWKPIYDAILQAVPNATFDGPSVVGEKKFGEDGYVLNLAKAIFPTGHLAMASNHYYFLGSGREGEKNPAANRDRFLSNDVHATYEDAYARVGLPLAREGVPYRIDELNSCFDGGAKDSSDTYASTLWALDCTHWWAAHHILGMNYHTGERVGRDGTFGAANYAAFLHNKQGSGIIIRPQGYAFLAFSQGAHGKPIPLEVHTSSSFNFDAYAYQDGTSIYLTLINKSYGAKARPASVSLALNLGNSAGTWQRMDLMEKDQDVAAKTGISLGHASITPDGTWAGQWETVQNDHSDGLTITVAPASAIILRFQSDK